MIQLKFSEEAIEAHKEYCNKIVRTRLELWKLEKADMAEQEEKEAKDITISCDYGYICEYLIRNMDRISVGSPEVLRQILAEVREDAKLSCIYPKSDHYEKTVNEEIFDCFSYHSFCQGSFGKNLTTYILNLYKIESGKRNQIWSFSKLKDTLKTELEEYDVLYGIRPGSSWKIFQRLVAEKEKSLRTDGGNNGRESSVKRSVRVCKKQNMKSFWRKPKRKSSK